MGLPERDIAQAEGFNYYVTAWRWHLIVSRSV